MSLLKSSAKASQGKFNYFYSLYFLWIFNAHVCNRLPISSIGQKSMNLTGKQLRANNPNYYEDSRSIFKGGRLREKSEGSNADLRNTDESKPPFYHLSIYAEPRN